MKSQFNKIIDDKGRVHIPLDLRKMAALQENDLIRMCVCNQMVIIERIDIPYVDLEAKLRAGFMKGEKEKEMPEDAIECFVLAALAKMDRSKLTEIMATCSEMLNK